MNNAIPHTIEQSFFTAVPDGFLFRDHMGVIREGSIVDSTPDGKYHKIEDMTGDYSWWYENGKIDFVYRPEQKASAEPVDKIS